MGSWTGRKHWIQEDPGSVKRLRGLLNSKTYISRRSTRLSSATEYTRDPDSSKIVHGTSKQKPVIIMSPQPSRPVGSE